MEANIKYHKICIKCNIDKQLSEFSKRKNSIDGHKNTCKKCANIVQKEWTKSNPEKIKNSTKKYYDKNSIIIKEKAKKSRKINNEKEREYGKKYRVEHKEETKDYNKKYREKNIEEIKSKAKEARKNSDKEDIKIKNKKWQEDNKEYVKEQAKIKRKEKPEVFKERQKKWRDKNPNYVKEYSEVNKELLKQKGKAYKDKPSSKENANKRIKERMKNDPIFKFNKNIRRRLLEFIKEMGYIKRAKTQEILGCSFEEFYILSPNLNHG